MKERYRVGDRVYFRGAHSVKIGTVIRAGKTIERRNWVYTVDVRFDDGVFKTRCGVDRITRASIVDQLATLDEG